MGRRRRAAVEALALRGHCSAVVDLLAQPVPFPYYWTLNLMLAVNLLLIAYAMIGAATLMSIPTYFIIVLVTLGMKARSCGEHVTRGARDATCGAARAA